MIGRFPPEISALPTVFSILEEERLKWQKVGMRAEDIYLDRGGDKITRAGANQTGIPRGSAGCPRVLTAGVRRGRIWSKKFPPVMGRSPTRQSEEMGQAIKERKGLGTLRPIHALRSYAFSKPHNCIAMYLEDTFLRA